LSILDIVKKVCTSSARFVCEKTDRFEDEFQNTEKMNVSVLGIEVKSIFATQTVRPILFHKIFEVL